MLQMVPQLLLSSEIEHFEVGILCLEPDPRPRSWLTKGRPSQKKNFFRKKSWKSAKFSFIIKRFYSSPTTCINTDFSCFGLKISQMAWFLRPKNSSECTQKYFEHYGTRYEKIEILIFRVFWHRDFGWFFRASAYFESTHGEFGARFERFWDRNS